MLFFAGGIVSVAAIGLWLFCLFDSVTAPAADIRGLQKALWVLVVLLLLDVGSILWLIFGRPRAGVPGLEQRDRRTDPWGGALDRAPRNPSRKTMAPDDDVEFLRSLNKPHPDDDGSTPAH